MPILATFPTIIAKSFNFNERNYEHVFEIVDKRWDSQLCQPLHVITYYLNPDFLQFYDEPVVASVNSTKVVSSFYECLERLVRDKVKHMSIIDDFNIGK